MHDVCTISFKLNNLKTSVGGQDFWREGFDDQFFWIFWWTITGSSEFRIWPVKFEVAWFEVCYIWIQSTTIWKKPDTSKWIIEVSTELHISSSFFAPSWSRQQPSNLFLYLKHCISSDFSNHKFNDFALKAFDRLSVFFILNQTMSY